MTEPARRHVLLLTVGTGDNTRLEESLYAPLLKSINSERWTRVLLLPSESTIAHAEEIAHRRADLDIEICPLSNAGTENDPDACYSYFEHQIGRLRDEGFTAADMIADFTRGTKAMSAALVLAAARHDIPVLRYIAGDRDVRGMVVAGSEEIVAISPAIATAHKQLDMALQFVHRGNFAGALALLPADDAVFLTWLEALRERALALRPALDFYAAWDRLDYRSAAALNPPAAAPLKEWQAVWPTPGMTAWVARLAEPRAESGAHALMANRLSLLAADLLANGERRIRDRQFEDAVLRAYRVLELIGQLRLFTHGLDSACLPPDHQAVLVLGAKLAKKKSASFGTNNRDGTLTAGRELVARLLKVLGDPLAETLLDFDKQPNLPRISGRNKSVLIHGFEAVGPDEDVPLRALYRKLEQLLLNNAGDAARQGIEVARSLDFSACSSSNSVRSATHSHLRSQTDHATYQAIDTKQNST